jgi:lipopolysaccharide/colanic/teichoic acid biosynthesis glycosyltransferase
MEPRIWSQSRTRTLIDRGSAALLALLTLPLLLPCLAISAVRFRANPVFRQERVGLNQTTFLLPKIRSLPATTSSTLDKYALNSVTYGKWTRLLRRSHLDELPQLWAVAAGHMSLVGPRPEMVGLSSTFDRDFVAMRTSVLPGITGSWQISEAAAELINESPEFDRIYVESASPRLDWWIVRRTLTNFASGEPATLVELKEKVERTHGEVNSVVQDQSVA